MHQTLSQVGAIRIGANQTLFACSTRIIQYLWKKYSERRSHDQIDFKFAKRRNTSSIVGAGLRSLLALWLAQRGYTITLYRKRPDLRKVTQDAGRSINWHSGDRGFKGIGDQQCRRKQQKLRIPMNGRMIHPRWGTPFWVRSSGRKTNTSTPFPDLDETTCFWTPLRWNALSLPARFNLGCEQVNWKGCGPFKNYETEKRNAFSRLHHW